ncbi:hypothetical protein [Paenibacillus sp. FSL R5-0701]|uniref:hypothetical protein n=1 Tax=Paenibacillus sp. FSL R5-0701 TaxID=2921654 RepID=UPI0030CF0E72
MIRNEDQNRKRRQGSNMLLMKPKEFEEYTQQLNEKFQNNYVNLKINNCVYCNNGDVPNMEIDVPLFSEMKTVISLKVKGAKCSACQREYFSKGSEILIARVKAAMDEPLPQVTETHIV